MKTLSWRRNGGDKTKKRWKGFGNRTLIVKKKPKKYVRETIVRRALRENKGYSAMRGRIAREVGQCSSCTKEAVYRVFVDSKGKIYEKKRMWKCFDHILACRVAQKEARTSTALADLRN